MGISTPVCLSWTVHNQHEFVQLTLTVKLTTHQLMLNQSSGPVQSWTNRLPSLGWQGGHYLDSIPPFCFAIFCRLNSEGTFLVELRKRTSPRQFRVISSMYLSGYMEMKYNYQNVSGYYVHNNTDHFLHHRQTCKWKL